MNRAVFIPHLPTRQNPLDGAWNPTISLTPASALGQVIIICDTPSCAEASRFKTSADKVHDAVIRSYKPGDYILFAGDPVLCSVAVYAAQLSLYDYKQPAGPVKALRWNRQQRSYDVLEIANDYF